MQRMKIIFYFLLFIYSTLGWTHPILPEQIPQALQDWQAWVLYDEPESTCPFLYTKQTDRYCAWPTQLTLDVQTDKIYFEQTWQVFAPTQITLPGNAQLWPQQVQVNGNYYPITEHEKMPVMNLATGAHRIQGFLPYTGFLESIKVPEHTGLIQLTQNGLKIDHPRLDDGGYLWLHYAENKPAADALQLRVFRKVIQAVPMEVQTLIELDVSGPAREVQLGPVLLPGTIAMRLDSSLPAQLDDKGVLRLQLRPGKWQVEISERFPKAIDTLKRAEVGPPWPYEEIWSFAFDSRLAGLNVSNVPNIDPSQTLMPSAWRSLPAYRVLVADSVLLTKVPMTQLAENQLSLTRHMWLDFSGKLWTVEDQLHGQMLSNWRLSLNPPFMLGRFSLDNQAQLITVLENNQGTLIPGVELRQGQLAAQAISLVENTGRMKVSAWDQNFNSVHTTISLPPGWQLLTAIGVDQLNNSLLSQWSLFDIFIVILVAFAITTIVGKKWGLMAFFMLLLTYHQASVSIFIWLNLVLVLWAVQWFTSTKGSALLKIYRDLSFVILAAMIVWLSSLSLMSSLYPQIAAKAIPAQELAEVRPMSRKSESALLMQAQNPFEVPLDAKTQTGPAQPQWEWTQVQLEWTTPVAPDQQVYLLLISPLVQLVLTIIQIILLISLGFQLWNMRTKTLHVNLNIGRSQALFFPLLATLLFGLMPQAKASEIPNQDLLTTLKERLLAPEDCLPQCASISAALVNITGDEIYLSLQIDASAPVAVPIPGRSPYWQAQTVYVNQLPAQALSWQDDTLMIQLEQGHHTVMVYGHVHALDKLSFDFPLNPHWVDVSAPQWFVEGLIISN